VTNGDIVTDIDLGDAYRLHRSMGNLATLIVHDHPSFNLLHVDDHLNIRDIATETGPGRLAFTGIHILEPELLSHIPAGVFSSIITCYRELIQSGAPIRAHIVTNPYWGDVGTIDGYKQANRDILQGSPLLQGEGCRVHPSVEIQGWAILGDGASIEEGVRLERSILWEHVRITKGRNVTDSIVADSKTIRHDLTSAVC
jgi:NDP-sugar pyrophosphorylase family protein